MLRGQIVFLIRDLNRIMLTLNQIGVFLMTIVFIIEKKIIFNKFIFNFGSYQVWDLGKVMKFHLFNYDNAISRETKS